MSALSFDYPALIAACRAEPRRIEIGARDYWRIVSMARADFAAGRVEAGKRGLVAIRYRLAQAVAARDAAWIGRLKAAEADLETRAA